jgi:hypothetical protein
MALRHLFFVLACAGVGVASFFSCDMEYRGGWSKLQGHLRHHLEEVAGGLREWAEGHGGWPASADGLPPLESLPDLVDLRGRGFLDVHPRVRVAIDGPRSHEVHCLTGAGPLTPFLLPYLYENRVGRTGFASSPVDEAPGRDWSVEVAPGVCVWSAEGRILARELTRRQREFLLVFGGAGFAAVVFGFLYLWARSRDEGLGRIRRGPAAAVRTSFGGLLLVAAVLACICQPRFDRGRLPHYGYFHSVWRSEFAAAVHGALRAYRDAGLLSLAAHDRMMAAMEQDGRALWNPELPFSPGSPR